MGLAGPNLGVCLATGALQDKTPTLSENGKEQESPQSKGTREQGEWQGGTRPGRSSMPRKDNTSYSFEVSIVLQFFDSHRASTTQSSKYFYLVTIGSQTLEKIWGTATSEKGNS